MVASPELTKKAERGGIARGDIVDVVGDWQSRKKVGTRRLTCRSWSNWEASRTWAPVAMWVCLLLSALDVVEIK